MILITRLAAVVERERKRERERERERERKRERMGRRLSLCGLLQQVCV